MISNLLVLCNLKINFSLVMHIPRNKSRLHFFDDNVNQYKVMTFGHSSASAMFVNNNIPTFECLIRRNNFSFTSRLKVPTIKLINTIENYWLLKYVTWKPLSCIHVILYLDIYHFYSLQYITMSIFYL